MSNLMLVRSEVEGSTRVVEVDGSKVEVQIAMRRRLLA